MPSGPGTKRTGAVSATRPAASASRESPAIRSIGRALHVLRSMNARETWSLQELQGEVGLPKTTLFRILQALRSEGYVRAEGSAGRYRVTSKIGELAAGYTEKSLVVDAGSPIALRVTKRIKWPLAIGTLDGDALVVRYSTMPYSPVAVHATTLGQRLGLLETAMGRVYLAFCDDAERSILCDLLFDALPADDKPERLLFERELEQVRRVGHAVRLPNWKRGSATLAVPVMDGDAVLAALSLTTFGRSMTPELVRSHLPVLQSTATEIAAACRLAHAAPPVGS
jgi:IclR family mhp operon transcriptional activator